MEPVRIAYRLYPADMRTSFELTVDRLRNAGVQIEIDIIERGFLYYLKHNKGHDVVVAHVSVPDAETDEFGFDLRDRFKNRQNPPILVAESPVHPLNQDIVFKHFAIYTKPLYDGNNLERLLSMQPEIAMRAFAPWIEKK